MFEHTKQKENYKISLKNHSMIKFDLYKYLKNVSLLISMNMFVLKKSIL